MSVGLLCGAGTEAGHGFTTVFAVWGFAPISTEFCSWGFLHRLWCVVFLNLGLVAQTRELYVHSLEAAFAGAKDVAEAMDLQTAYWRKQFGAFTAQASEMPTNSIHTNVATRSKRR